MSGMIRNRLVETRLTTPPLCAVSHRYLVQKSAEAVQQRRFEAICARELLGELD